MTEAEWLACGNPVAMLAYLDRPAGDRKLRLYAVACCRLLWNLLPEQASRDGVEWAERFADGLAARDDEYTRVEWKSEGAFFKYDHQRAIGAEQGGSDTNSTALLADAAYLANSAMCFDACVPYDPGFRSHSRMLAVEPLRDIFGNPFRPVAFDPAWRTDTAVSLARQMYDARDFGAMPILADALQDAGCDHVDILDHCRGAGPHVRGCWVVDLVLGKA